MIAHAQRGLAAVGAVRADGGNVLHFPGARLVAIRAAGERAYGANVDAHAALFALEVVATVRDNDAVCAAHAHAERLHVHTLVANAYAAETQNASGSVVVDQLRPLFFGTVDFFFDEAARIGAIAEDHVLEFAFAALVADGAVERVVGEKKLEHVLAGLADLVGVGANDHAFGRHESACRLQLRRLFDFDEAHAAGGLEREAGVVAEGRDFRAEPARGFNDQRAWRDLNFAVVHLQLDEFLVCHEFLARPFAFSLSTWFYRAPTSAPADL